MSHGTRDQSEKPCFDFLPEGLRSARVIAVLTVFLLFGHLYAQTVSLVHADPKAFVFTFLFFQEVTSGCLGALALYFFLPIRRSEALTVVVLGTLAEAALWSTRIKVHPKIEIAILSIGTGLGAVAWLATLFRAWQGKGEESRLAQALALIGVLLPLGFVAGGWMQSVAHLSQDLLYDAYAYALDSCTGISPAIICNSIARSSEVSRWFFYGLYSHLSLIMAVAAGLGVVSSREEGNYFDVLTALTVAAIMGTCLYNLYPIAGPAEFFGSRYQGENFVPWRTLPSTVLTPIAAPPGVPRNTMPSMHATWGFLAALTMIRKRRLGWRVFGYSFALLNLVSAAFVGHYIIDFVVAFPLTLLVVALTSRPRLTTTKSRVLAQVLALAMLTASYGTLYYGVEFFLAHPVLFTLAELGVIGLCLGLERRLFQESRSPLGS